MIFAGASFLGGNKKEGADVVCSLFVILPSAPLKPKNAAQPEGRTG